MKKITVFVACHKPSELYTDEMYRPIHVGRIISTCADEMNMIGDDTGDNISEKNPFYSELTAQYWAWKNFHETEYIGFCHYRRYFKKDMGEMAMLDMFRDGTDVIVVGPCMRRFNRWNFLQTFVESENLAIMLMVVRKLYPEYYGTLSRYANDFIDYPLNMLICRKELFDEYAEWLFSILFQCEKYVKNSPYTRARRLYGYLAEFLMPVFFMYHGYKMTAVPYHCIGEQGNRGGLSLSQNLGRLVLKRLLYAKDQKRKVGIDYSVAAGLQGDGIEILEKMI